MLHAVVCASFVAATWIGLSLAAPSAGAQSARCTDYAPPAPTVSPMSSVAGGTVTMTGVALPGATVTLTLKGTGIADTPLGTTTADANGAFSIVVTIPAGIPAGTYQIVAVAAQCPQPITVIVVVTPPQGPGTESTTSTTTTQVASSGSTTTTTQASGGGASDTTTTLASSTADVGSEVQGATSSRESAAASAPPTGGLAFTGGAVRPLIVIAIAAVAVGALLIGSARRRSSGPPS